ncbi:MAG: hypothetical protein WD359_05905 [Dehalococcoidia bacterium]
MTATVVIAVSDLLFQTRIEGAVAAMGLTPLIADTAQRLDAALESRVLAAVFDVHEAAFAPNEAIARASAAGTRVLAFGRHTSPKDLRAARVAGAEIVVPRSELVDRLPELLRRLLPEDDADIVEADSASL